MLKGIAVDDALAKHLEAFRQSEGSVRLEGIDPTAYPVYVALKARILAGEITTQEALAILRDEYTNIRLTAA